jgi:hypothetical protein
VLALSRRACKAYLKPEKLLDLSLNFTLLLLLSERLNQLKLLHVPRSLVVRRELESERLEYLLLLGLLLLLLV